MRSPNHTFMKKKNTFSFKYGIFWFLLFFWTLCLAMAWFRRMPHIYQYFSCINHQVFINSSIVTQWILVLSFNIFSSEMMTLFSPSNNELIIDHIDNHNLKTCLTNYLCTYLPVKLNRLRTKAEEIKWTFACSVAPNN